MEESECRVGPAVVNGSEPEEHVQVGVRDVALLEREVEDLESELDHRVV